MTKLEELMQLNGITKLEKQTDEERIKQLEEQNEMLVECLLELADIIYS